MATDAETITRELQELKASGKIWLADFPIEHMAPYWHACYGDMTPRTLFEFFAKDIPDIALGLHVWKHASNGRNFSILELHHPAMQDEKNMLVMLDIESHYAEFHTAFLKDQFQGNGLSKVLCAKRVEWCLENGITAIGLETEQIGGYLWAKAGYKPTI